MYLSYASMWRSPKLRADFRAVADYVSSMTKKSRASVRMDMLFSGFAYGASPQEYENLKFYERTPKNRATFITSYYNIHNYKKLNKRSDREIFRDKVRFNTTFARFIGREWILIDGKESKAFEAFLKKHGSVIIKPRFGDSGKDIAFCDDADRTEEEIRALAAAHSGCLAEEILHNHEKIRALNPSSLNTIRIITIVTKEDVDYLYAGLRIGAPDVRVDNISRGGKVAVIDLDDGRIETGFVGKQTSAVDFDAGDRIGLSIPNWDELKVFVKEAAHVVPGVRYVAWDVAVTPDGPVLIEGNHSSGNTVTQASIALDAPGLRPRLEEILKKC